ncbi:hypothetical protein B0J11DRAFT_440431 [Dendryphion nanum]|uniref:Uncharacterized protein n=1 Tax=Dendryphion nanum TaxID=256645 RepID=A0A9P9IER6_9PLEO|nr:hypothetical protein B0J11DRAFT_440431 [Dendryphion nanum]
MLKSPTQLLKDRLNLSPKKRSHEKLRKFTPPKPMLNGCILPGPSAQLEAFTGKDVRACTESGKTAWWCKFDKLVVFDGVDETSANENDIKFKTRSSKGLSIARRRGDCETVVIPLECTHCQEMLNRSDWKYDIQVCKRSVCWDCKERCLWEMNNAQREPRLANGDIPAEREQNRERADSVLQDEEREQEEELLRKVGIESVLMSASPLELD